MKVHKLLITSNPGNDPMFTGDDVTLEKLQSCTIIAAPGNSLLHHLPSARIPLIFPKGREKIGDFLFAFYFIMLYIEQENKL